MKKTKSKFIIFSMHIGIIPARFNSSRFLGKLLFPIEGKTLLRRTYENALRCSQLDQILIATDDERIAEEASRFPAKVIFTSPSCSSGTTRIGEVLEKCPDLKQVRSIINLQGDHPCTSPNTISQIIQIMEENPLTEMATAVIPMKDSVAFSSPHIVKCVFDQNYNALYFSRSPIPYKGPYFHHLGIYGYRPQALLKLLSQKDTPLQISEDLEQLKALEYGLSIKVAVVEDPAIGIDTPEDIKQLKEVLWPA